LLISGCAGEFLLRSALSGTKVKSLAVEAGIMAGHIVSSYDAELAELDRTTAEMGGLAEALLRDALQALERRDPKLAQAAFTSDRTIDELQRQLQERAVITIARRQPMANDLRHIMTVLKIAADLERIGDHAKNIAKRTLAIAGESHPKPLVAGLRHMGDLASRQLKNVLDAFITQDNDKALAVWHSDVDLDALYNSVFRELLTYMMEDPRNIGLCTHLLFCAKNIERIGDHTTNIAEDIHYLVTGRILTDDRAKGDDTSSILISPGKG
jgi:phosphate transport system protein